MFSHRKLIETISTLAKNKAPDEQLEGLADQIRALETQLEILDDCVDPDSANQVIEANENNCNGASHEDLSKKQLPTLDETERSSKHDSHESNNNSCSKSIFCSVPNALKSGP